MKPTQEQLAQESHFRQLGLSVAMDDDDMRLSLLAADADTDARLRAEVGLQREWALLSPCMPRSERAREELNLFYFNELRYEREDRTGIWRKAVIHEPSDNWPNEPCFLLVDPQLRWVMDLARRCHQKAFFAARVGEAPRLIWL